MSNGSERIPETSDAEVLREAARLMRERAAVCQHAVDEWYTEGDVTRLLRRADPPSTIQQHDAEHIASWHPAVALAVAALLDEHADGWDTGAWTVSADDHALAVARAYLGSAS